MIERFQPQAMPRPTGAVERPADARTGAALPTGPAPAGVPAAQPSVAAELSSVAADLASAPPVDEARVAALREQMAAGSYRLDPQAVADAMIRSVTGS